MSQVGIYNIDTQTKDDTFNGVQYTFTNESDDSPVDLTDAAIKTEFRVGSPRGQVVKEITVDNGITIDDAINGVMSFDSFIIDWRATTYKYDIQITFPNGVVKTYVRGSLIVEQDTTY